jgi:hypothetical protein
MTLSDARTHHDAPVLHRRGDGTDEVGVIVAVNRWGVLVRFHPGQAATATDPARLTLSSTLVTA